MEGRERKRPRDEKSRKKSRAEKSEDYVDKLIHHHILPTPQSDTITMTTSTYPDDSEYTDIIQPLTKNEYKKRERSRQRTNQIQGRHRSRSEEQRKDEGVMKNVKQVEESEEDEDGDDDDDDDDDDDGDDDEEEEAAEGGESSKEDEVKEDDDDEDEDEGRTAVVGRLERVVSSDCVRKRRSRSHSEQKKVKEVQQKERKRHKEEKDGKKSHHKSSRIEENRDHVPREEKIEHLPREEKKNHTPRDEKKGTKPKEEKKNHTPREEKKNHVREEKKSHTLKEEKKNHTPREEKKNHVPKEDKKYNTPQDEKKSQMPREEKKSHTSREHKNADTLREKHKSKDHHLKLKSVSEKLEDDTIRADKQKIGSHVTKHITYKQTDDLESDDDDKFMDEKYHARTTVDKKSSNDTRHGRTPKKSPASPKRSKSKLNCSDKLRETKPRSVSENRENSLKESLNEKKSRSSKKKIERTESQGGQKKDKKCKRCKSQVIIGERQRTCYSDSELDIGNGPTKVKSNGPPFGTDSDVSAMCHVFSTKGINVLDSSHSTRESKTSKESKESPTDHKVPHAKQSEALTCAKCQEKRSNSSKHHKSSSSSDSIRNKLISALFQRIKSLLKEVEDVKEEKNALSEKVVILTAQYEKLRAKDQLQQEQECIIKEKIETLAEQMKVSNKGTFRDEVHNILKNIQQKYQTHWTEHEHKISQVQNDAEQEIQSLMKNIVSKYVELGEMKDRAESTSHSVKPKHVTEPLFISCTKSNSNNSSEATTGTNPPSLSGIEEMIYSKAQQSRNELLLKIADATKGDISKKQSLQTLCRENLVKNHEYPLQPRQEKISIPLSLEKTNQLLLSRDTTSSASKLSHDPTNKYITCTTIGSKYNSRKNHDTGEHRSSSEDAKTARSSCDDSKLTFSQHKQPSGGSGGGSGGSGTSIYDKTSNSADQGLLTKKDAREFWRLRLSQPTTSLDTQKEYRENELSGHTQTGEKGRSFY